MPMMIQASPTSCSYISAPTGDAALAKRDHCGASSKRILVADDDASIRGCIAIVLTRKGFDVETAKDGEEAWTAICKTEFDLVITDHEMPHLTGLNLIRKVRNASMDAPFILISASLPGPESMLIPLIQPGALLSKPFAFGSLLKVVFSLLRQDPPRGVFS